MSSTQAELQDDYQAFVQSADARAALDYLIAHATGLPGYQCFLQRQGYLRTLRYMQAEVWPFGFIVNRKSVLFYFRKAGLSNPAASVESLSKLFDEVQKNKRGEIKVRLQTESDARRLAVLVFGHV